MRIIDKAAWQIDGGVPKNTVVQHFKTVFEWLDKKNMLTEEGQEELADGIDECASLHERLISSEALAFFVERYDDYLKRVEYGGDEGARVLDRLYNEYAQDRP